MKRDEDSHGGRYNAIRGMDPSGDWLLGPALEDYLPNPQETLIPFIMSLNDEGGLNFFRERFGKPPIYISEKSGESLEIGKPFPAFAPKSFFDTLADKDGEYAVLRSAGKEIKLCLPLPFSQPAWKPGDPVRVLAAPRVEPPEGGWPDGTVVMGIIDDGIGLAHERFRDAAGKSRVQCFWRQDGPNVSPTVDYGKEIFKLDSLNGDPGIDSLLAQSKVAGAVDEDTFYRLAGLIDFAESRHKTAAWRASHGTHVLDMAAGADPADNVTKRPIVCVQLDPALVEDTTLASVENTIMDGIDYILDRADAISTGGDPLPVVINLSFGNIAGPHDGTSVLEQFIENRLQAHPGRLRVVLPSGNSHLSRCYAGVQFAAIGEVVELPWRVQPDDTTASFMEIWLPHAGAGAPGAARMRLSVRSPAGDETPVLGEVDAGQEELEKNGEQICQVTYRFMSNPTERGVFKIHLQPTTRFHPTALVNRIAPAGLWKIRLHNVSLENADSVHAWIHRDDRVYSYPRRGRQSYFDDPWYVRYDSKGFEIEEDNHLEQPACNVRRVRLLNAIAAGHRMIVAGSFGRCDLQTAKYSAGGPMTPPRGADPNAEFRKPDALLAGDDSRIHAGVLAAGSRGGSVVAFSGTSVAAPQLARWVADDISAGNNGDRATVKAEAQEQEGTLPVTKPPLPPNQRGGWGRMRDVDGLPVVKPKRCLCAPLNRVLTGGRPP